MLGFARRGIVTLVLQVVGKFERFLTGIELDTPLLRFALTPCADQPRAFSFNDVI